MAKRELLASLTEEQVAKVKSCKNADELLAVAKAEGIELTDEQLASVSGGFHCSTPTFTCPSCGSTDIDAEEKCNHVQNYWSLECRNCHYKWTT